MSSLSQQVRVVARTSQRRCLGTGVTLGFNMEPEKQANKFKKTPGAIIFMTIAVVSLA